ncbi:MAG: hypothetical protein LBG11_11435 [Bifidobacteriaceae bacterium]|jgi:hypothetical protein|nr:hypothetical protein [Bifidobacteriaceae bacterium]
MRVGLQVGWLAVAPVLLALGLAGCSSSSTAGQYAASEIEVSEEQVSPGQTVTLSGWAFTTKCEDDCPRDSGAVWSEDGGWVGEPLRDLAIEWREGDQVVSLGSVDATGEEGTFEVEVTVPADAVLGAATIFVGGEQLDRDAAEVEVTVSE